MSSTLGYAILGLLAREQLTGYVIAARMRRPVGYFWASRHSQIYPELARLEAERLVRHTVVAGPGPRQNKRYTITAKGRRALAAWVATPPEPTPEKDEFALRIYSLWLLSADQARALVLGHRQTHAERLQEYEQVEARVLADDATSTSSPDFASYATLRAGLSYERHVIGWCDWLLERLGDG